MQTRDKSKGKRRTARDGVASFLIFALCLLPFAFPQVIVGQQEKRSSAGRENVSPAGAWGGAAERSAPSLLPPAPRVLVAAGEDYRIGPGDVIEVQIEDAPELSRAFRITAAGTFLMPYLGRITAQDKTTEELAKLIADGLRGRYLNDPIVTVVVKEYNSRSFFIQGAVRSPGVYQLEGRPSLLKLLTLAGGLAENHGSTAFIIREVKPPGAAAEDRATGSSEPKAAPGAPSDPQEGEKYQLKKINIAGLFKGRFAQNLLLEPGDIVNIPPADVFFVAGEVKAPGSFPLKEGTTLRQAISLAQGTNFKATLKRGIIFREDPDTGQRTEIPVDIGAVMSGKKEDVLILANDIVLVPNSKAKSVAAPMLSAFGLSLIRFPIY
jgi:polysaccharide export outer membrane protein